ncbi:hypothetical protein HpBT0363_14560 [Helicobacter pylori]
MQEKNGQVAGAAFRDDLGGIDFVWGTPKTKDSVGYGLAHILERRISNEMKKGLSEAEAKEYALNIIKSIPEVLEKGTKGTDHLGRVFVDYGNKRVGLNNTWNNKDLENHWVISSYELRDITEKPTHFPTSQAITKEKDIHSLNSVGPNPTTRAQKTQDLSPLEQANAEKLAKLESENLESALFFKQIAQYSKGLRLKILTAPSNKKDLERLEQLEKTINQEEERLKGKNLNEILKEIQKEQENALKLKESIKASQNHTETLKNAINQKEHAKNPIQQQKQNLESQRNEKEQEKQTQENAKRNQEQERNNLNNEINAIGNERLTIKELGTKDNFLGIQPYLNNNGAGRTYARAFFSDKNKSIREYYEIETKIKNILGFYRIGESEERVLKRFLELSQAQQNELSWLILDNP